MANLVKVDDPQRVQRGLSRALANLQWYADSTGQSPPAAQLIITTLRDAMTHVESLDAYFDSEPVVFDDLIEVRTGGDRAMGLVLVRPDAPIMASALPLRAVLDEFIDDTVQPFLEELESTPHIVPMQAGSQLETEATIDWGYRPVRLGGGAQLRLYAPDRWARDVKEHLIAAEAARTERMRREMQAMQEMRDNSRYIRQEDQIPERLSTSRTTSNGLDAVMREYVGQRSSEVPWGVGSGIRTTPYPPQSTTNPGGFQFIQAAVPDDEPDEPEDDAHWFSIDDDDGYDDDEG